MGKYGFEEYQHEKTFYEDDEIGFETGYDDDQLVDTDSEETETYICEDCSHKWQLSVSERGDLFDYYNGDRSGNVCPMCGSFSIYVVE